MDYFSTHLHEAKALKLNSLCDESTTGLKGGRFTRYQILADYFSTHLHEAKALKLNSLCDESTTGLKGGRLDFYLEFLLDGLVAT